MGVNPYQDRWARLAEQERLAWNAYCKERRRLRKEAKLFSQSQEGIKRAIELEEEKARLNYIRLIELEKYKGMTESEIVLAKELEALEEERKKHSDKSN